MYSSAIFHRIYLHEVQLLKPQLRLIPAPHTLRFYGCLLLVKMSLWKVSYARSKVQHFTFVFTVVYPARMWDHFTKIEILDNSVLQYATVDRQMMLFFHVIADSIRRKILNIINSNYYNPKKNTTETIGKCNDMTNDIIYQILANLPNVTCCHAFP